MNEFGGSKLIIIPFLDKNSEDFYYFDHSNIVNNTVYDLKELCNYLKIGKNTALELLNSNKIKGYHFGRNCKWTTTQKDINEFVLKQLNNIETSD